MSLNMRIELNRFLTPVLGHDSKKRQFLAHTAMEKEGEASAAQEILEGLNVDVNRLLPVPEKAFAKAWIQGNDSYLQMYRESMDDAVGFWDKVRKKRKSELGRTWKDGEGEKEAENAIRR